MGVASQWVHGARVCVIPRPENNYEPLALRRRSLALLTALLIVSKLAALAVLGLMPHSAELSVITTARILQLTNQERVQRGLPALTVNPQLAEAAQRKAQDMLEHDYFAHISPTGVTPWFWMAQTDYHYRVAGENLAIDFTQAEDVVRAWLNSPSHRENLLENRYTETGVAVLTGQFEGGTSTVVVHMFGEPAVAAATAPVSTPPAAASAAAGPTPAPQAPAEPSPSPAPPIPAPRIALPDGTERVATSTVLSIQAEPSVTVYVRVGDTVAASAAVPENGRVSVSVPLLDAPDGPLTLSAYVRSADGRSSPLSEPLTAVKDSVGPALTRESLHFLLSPATDHPRLALIPPELAYETLTVAYGREVSVYRPGAVASALVFPLSTQPARITVTDELGNASGVDGQVLAPAFMTERETDFARSPAILGRLSRRLALAIGLVLGILLLGAILIRIRIQHPQMIAHASLVLLLAGVLFFW